MKCPVCKEPDLMMADRQGIEIDYCPQCRGVWLDRGELDKIIERSPESVAAPVAQPSRANIPDQRPQNADYRRDKDVYHKENYHHKKRKGFLGELFDFD